jgi:hypothetical protein
LAAFDNMESSYLWFTCILSMVRCQEYDVYESQDLQWADILGESSPG